MVSATPCAVVLGLASLLLLAASEENGSSVWPVGNPNRCLEIFAKTMQDIQRFEVFPGLGWDNLRNIEMSQVVDFTFNKCRLTDDGRYLIPDNVFTIPIKVFAELIDQWKNTASLTSRSINVQAGLSFFSASISGKYSAENLELKSKQWHDQAVTTRVKLQYNRYQAKLQVDPQLSPQFKSRLMSLAARVELNHTEMAYYEAQLIVRDFGTHFLKSVTAGAALVKDDFIKNSFASAYQVGSTQMSNVLAAASYGFFSLYGFRNEYKHTADSTVSKQYTDSLTDSTVQALGGPLIKAKDMTVDQWVDGVDTNLVPMDRAGDPLYFIITHQTLPDLPESTTVEVATHVRRAIEEYYDMNIIRGCTDRDSPQFSPYANFNDGSCEPATHKVRLGGVYQQCLAYGTNPYNDPCNGLNQVNPSTGGHSCPKKFRPVQIYSGRKLGYTACRRRCQRCGKSLDKQCCRRSCFQGTAYYHTFWCAAEPNKPIDEGAGYHFGGIYTKTTYNLLTGAMNCPKGFTARRMLADMFVCIGSGDNLKELATPFGGFFSCQTGNPLAAREGEKEWPTRCPEGFSQHLATVTMGCAYHYCVESAMLNGSELPALKAPPFMMKPAVPMSEGDPMAENTTIVIDTDSQTWRKDQDAQDFLDKQEVDQQEVEAGERDQQNPNPQRPPEDKMTDQTGGEGGSAGLSAGAASVIAIFCTLIVVAIVLVGFVGYRRYQRHNRAQRNRGPERENEEEQL